MAIVIIFLAALLASTAAPAAAQAPPAYPFGITDNSFLIEEAFNQDPGIFQNIFVMARNADHEWDGSFTQEWPVLSQRHQLSFTLPFSATSNAVALGDLGLNYRVQVTDGKGRFPAFSPRVTLLSPTSAAQRSLGWGGAGPPPLPPRLGDPRQTGARGAGARRRRSDTRATPLTRPRPSRFPRRLRQRGSRVRGSRQPRAPARRRHRDQQRTLGQRYGSVSRSWGGLEAWGLGLEA